MKNKLYLAVCLVLAILMVLPIAACAKKGSDIIPIAATEPETTEETSSEVTEESSEAEIEETTAQTSEETTEATVETTPETELESVEEDTEETAEETTEETEQIGIPGKIEIAKLEREYTDKYLKVLNPCKLHKVIHAEGAFQRHLMKEMTRFGEPRRPRD